MVESRKTFNATDSFAMKKDSIEGINLIKDYNGTNRSEAKINSKKTGSSPRLFIGGANISWRKTSF